MVPSFYTLLSRKITKHFTNHKTFPQKISACLKRKLFRNPDKIIAKHTSSLPHQEDNTLKEQNQHVESAVSTR